MRSVRFIFLLFASLLLSCTMFKLLPNEKRPIISKEIQIKEGLSLSSVGSVSINNKDFMPAATRISYQDIIIYIDPVAVKHSDSADIILISHAHGDHYSLNDIKKLAKPSTIILAPFHVASKLRNEGYSAEGILPNEIWKFQKVTIESYPSYNTENIFFFLKAHPENSNNLSYIINLNDETRIFYPGDSHYIPEFKTLNAVDIILVPLGDGTLTMSNNDAINMILDLNPSVVIPVHYLMNFDFQISQFAKRIPESTKFYLFE